MLVIYRLFPELFVRFLSAAAAAAARAGGGAGATGARRNAVSGGGGLPLVRRVTSDLGAVLITGPQRLGGCGSALAGRENRPRRAAPEEVQASGPAGTARRRAGSVGTVAFLR